MSRDRSLFERFAAAAPDANPLDVLADVSRALVRRWR